MWGFQPNSNAQRSGLALISRRCRFVRAPTSACFAAVGRSAACLLCLAGGRAAGGLSLRASCRRFRRPLFNRTTQADATTDRGLRRGLPLLFGHVGLCLRIAARPAAAVGRGAGACAWVPILPEPGAHGTLIVLLKPFPPNLLYARIGRGCCAHGRSKFECAPCCKWRGQLTW
jgi:hypothetical protein